MLSFVSWSMPFPRMSVLRIQILHASIAINVMADVLMMISPNVCSVIFMKCSVGIVYSHPIGESSLIKLSLVIESASLLFANVTRQ